MTEQELEEHRARMQALMRETIAPLLERIDAAETSLAAERVAVAAQNTERLAEARARFRASLVTELAAGGLASNTFDWNNPRAEVVALRDLADRILAECGMPW